MYWYLIATCDILFKLFYACKERVSPSPPLQEETTPALFPPNELVKLGVTPHLLEKQEERRALLFNKPWSIVFDSQKAPCTRDSIATIQLLAKSEEVEGTQRLIYLFLQKSGRFRSIDVEIDVRRMRLRSIQTAEFLLFDELLSHALSEREYHTWKAILPH